MNPSVIGAVSGLHNTVKSDVGGIADTTLKEARHVGDKWHEWSKASENKFVVNDAEAGNQYVDKLRNIDRTTQTTNNIVNILSNPRTIVALIVVFAVLFLFGASIVKLVKEISKTIKKNRQKNAAIKRAEDKTNQVSELSVEEMDAICSDVESAFGWWSDNNSAVVAAVRRIPTVPDWAGVNELYSTRNHKCKGPGKKNHKHTMAAAIMCNMSNTKQELTEIYNHLQSLNCRPEDYGITLKNNW